MDERARGIEAVSVPGSGGRTDRHRERTGQTNKRDMDSEVRISFIAAARKGGYPSGQTDNPPSLPQQ